MRRIPYRLLCTATAAPNDYIELGTSSEALGYLGFMDMLNKFFKNDQNNSATRRMYGEAPKWRFRGHAEIPFWQWVCSWARALRKPSDLGFDDQAFVLPPLVENEHLVKAERLAPGMLFAIPARDLREQREERKRTITERCEKIAEIVNHDKPALVWCHLNDEGDMLEKIIPDAIQVSGKDSDEKKEEKLMAFTDGKARVLVTKQKIAGWGMNWQHCAHIALFPSHSYEQLYQGVRRCWRFGQKNPVTVDMVLTEGERKVQQNLQRKAQQADEMFTRLVEHMNHARGIERKNDMTKKGGLPPWM
jgi:superfamily II DNA or RNA helicase